MNSHPPIDPADPRWLLSALADGEADAATTERGCAAWAGADAAARQSWHAYHLIGDVLRSDDLASAPARDQAFLDRLRVRLADEPAILAPQPLPRVATPSAPARSRRGWALPMAMAAGVMALAVGLVVTLNTGGPRWRPRRSWPRRRPARPWRWPHPRCRPLPPPNWRRRAAASCATPSWIATCVRTASTARRCRVRCRAAPAVASPPCPSTAEAPRCDLLPARGPGCRC